MVDATTVSDTRSSSRRKMLSSLQEGAMYEALHTLRKLRAGHVSAMTNSCSQIDALLVDYANLTKVKSLTLKTEIAELEVKLAEAEYSELVMLNAKSSSHSGHVSGLAFGITSNTSSLTTPCASTQVYMFRAVSTQALENESKLCVHSKNL